jgi:hypothetical protein
MAAAKPMTSMDISDIQRQMAQIRNEMHQEVQGAVRTAQYLTDWQAVVKSHPWLSLTIASAIGYLFVPRRHSPTPTIVAVNAPRPSMMPAALYEHPDSQPKKGHWKILGTAFGLLVPIGVRAAQNYALRHLEGWLSQHPLPSASGTPPSRPQREPGQSTSTGPASRLREFR